MMTKELGSQYGGSLVGRLAPVSLPLPGVDKEGASAPIPASLGSKVDDLDHPQYDKGAES